MLATTLGILMMATPPLTVSRALVELFPPERLPLGGYTARGGKLMDEGGDMIFSCAAVLSQGSTKLVVVSCEMLTIPESLTREVAKRIDPHAHLFLIATHTHCAPDSQMLNDRMTFSVPGIASFKSRWLDFYADRIAEGIKKAESAEPITVKAWQVRTTHIPLNRGRRKGAWPDTTATLVSALDQEGKSSNLWFNFAAHAVFHGPERNRPSGDWPGRIALATGADVLVGAIGDVSPAVLAESKGESADDKITDFTLAMTARLKAAVVQMMPVAPRIGWVTESIPLAKPVPHPDFAKSNRIPEALAQMLVEKFAPPQANISAFRLGKIAVVGIPGEPTSHLGRQIRDYGRRLGFTTVWVCSHVNGWMGYILGPDDYDAGGYETTLSFFGREEGNKVVNAAERALDQLARP